jgi:hypothetical protein
VPANFSDISQELLSCDHEVLRKEYVRTTRKHANELKK